MKFLSWLWRRPCAHVWVYAAVVEGGQQVKRQHCIHCGKIGQNLDTFVGASSGAIGGGGGDGGGDGC